MINNYNLDEPLYMGTFDHSKEKEFIDACLDNDVVKVRYLLKTPLKKYRYLDPNYFNDYVFRITCANGYTEIVEMLLSLEGINRVRINNSDFIMACKNGRLGVIKLLLTLTGDRFIDVNSG